MKNKETDIWGFIAFIAFVVMIWTVGASEAEYLSNKAFSVGFAVQALVWIYSLYRAKAFIWQSMEAEEEEK